MADFDEMLASRDLALRAATQSAQAVVDAGATILASVPAAEQARDAAAVSAQISEANSLTDPSGKRYLVAMVLAGFSLAGMGAAEVDQTGRVIQATFADGSRLTGNAEPASKRGQTAVVLAGFAPAGVGAPEVDQSGVLVQARLADGSPLIGAGDPVAKRGQNALVLSGFTPAGIGAPEVDQAGRLVQARLADGSALIGAPSEPAGKRGQSALLLGGFMPAGLGGARVDQAGRLVQAMLPDGSAAVSAGDVTGKGGMTALLLSGFTRTHGRVGAGGVALPGSVDRQAGWIMAQRQAPPSGIAYISGVTPNRAVVAFLDDGRTITVSKPGDDPDLLLQSGDVVKYRRTTAAVSGGAATMVDELLAAEVVQATATALRLVMMHGQSNSAGYSTSPSAVVTKTPVRAGRARMFVAGPNLGLQALADVTRLAPIAALVDLREIPRSAQGETPLSGIAYSLTQPYGVAVTTEIIAATAGIGSAGIGQLSKGTQPYANLLRTVQRATTIARRLGLPLKVLEVPWIQGEANIGSITATAYKADLTQLQSDLDADIRAITGQAETVMLVGAQTSSWFNNTTNAQSSTPLAIVELALQYPARFACSGPMYPFPYEPTSTLHLKPQGHRNHGETIGRVIARKDAGVAMPFLAAKSAVLSGTTITLDYSSAEGALVLDTSIVSDPGQYGFEFGQTGGNAVTVTDVAISGTSVVLTLSAAPTGAAPWVGVALTGTVGALPGPTTGARCCLRDTSAQQRADGSYLHNYACHQRIAL